MQPPPARPYRHYQSIRSLFTSNEGKPFLFHENSGSNIGWRGLPCQENQTEFNEISVAASAYSQNSDELYDEYEDQPQRLDNKETELMKAPTFLSLAGQFSVNVGDTVRLPCLVDRLEGFVILWKKGTTILTVASQIIDKVRLRRTIIIR